MKTTLALTLGLLSLSAYAQSFLPRVGGETFQQVAEVTGTQVGDYFGYSVAVSGNTLVVGAPNAPDDVCGNCGAAYVYTAPDGDWAGLTQVATLTPPAGQSIPGGFGYPVAISGDTIAVGGVNPAGEAITYVYVDPAGNATATGELTTTVESGGQINGIAIDGGTVAVSMPYASIGTQRAAGSVFVYVEPLGGWANMTQTAQLAFKGVEDIDFFGASVGVSGRYIAVGATQVKVRGSRTGSGIPLCRARGGMERSAVTDDRV
jgi:hypothetical protein